MIKEELFDFTHNKRKLRKPTKVTVAKTDQATTVSEIADINLSKDKSTQLTDAQLKCNLLSIKRLEAKGFRIWLVSLFTAISLELACGFIVTKAITSIDFSSLTIVTCLRLLDRIQPHWKNVFQTTKCHTRLLWVIWIALIIYKFSRLVVTPTFAQNH